MSRPKAVSLTAAVWAGFLAAGSPALAGDGQAGVGPAVVDPHVTTDKSVDCRTVDSIVKSLIKDGMSDEEKVLAVFNWIKRVIYHGDGPRELAYNFHNMINIYGHGSCLRQTTPMWVLLDRLGYKCRGWATGGHHCIQVFYGGKWHLFDPHMNFYVYDRGTPRSIASIEQIKEDPTLASDAVKEGRACPGLLLCGDSIDTFATKTGWKDMGDFPESKKYTPVIEEPFGRIALRRGESYVRTWMPGPYWFTRGYYKKDTGPRHGCGERDLRDTANAPLYEPHGWKGKYRHWGAGCLVYKPDLSTGRFADAVVQRTNIAVPGKDAAPAGLALEDPAKPGEIVFSVECPYVITAGELALQRSGTAEVKASVSNDQGKSWKPVELKPDGDATKAVFVEEVNGSFKGYWLKIELAAGAGLKALELRSHFQENAFSLPFLVPGKNVVTVEAGNYGSPLTLTWKWSQGPGWKDAKTFTKTFTANSSAEVEVGGPKYPRMESLVLSVAP